MTSAHVHAHFTEISRIMHSVPAHYVTETPEVTSSSSDQKTTSDSGTAKSQSHSSDSDDSKRDKSKSSVTDNSSNKGSERSSEVDVHGECAVCHDLRQP